MCGIYSTNIDYKKEEILQKLRKIKFRGPDNLGYKKHNMVSMAHLRLSILDLDSRSNQPFQYENLSIVYNGEVYNFKEIKKELEGIGYNFRTMSDTEVVIIGFKHWGAEVLNKLNGMFAFSIYDSEKNIIFSARDRLGVKPLFYYWKEGLFEICSQLRPLINSHSRLSEEALSIYLDCGYVPSPYCVIENVHKLSPACYMEIDLNTNSLSVQKYWDLAKIKVRDITYENAKSELHELLTDAVKIRLQSDVPLGSFLSGGIDSSLVSSIAAKVSSQTINTFSIGFKDPRYDESKVAAEYAKIIKSNHTEIICDPKDVLQMLPKLIEVYDEPFADSSALPSLLLNSVTKKYVTVALSGDGGDESFLGYKHFLLVDRFNKISWIPYRFRKFIAFFPWYKILGGRRETIPSILGSKSSEELSLKIFTGFSSIVKNRSNWTKQYSYLSKLSHDPIQKAADLNIKLWLENDSNVKVDRASMAYSVEVRSPFLDYRIVEFARQLPTTYRFKRNKQKRILKDTLKEYIPEKIFNQPKKGFSIPKGKWIREELREEIIKELNDDFLEKVPNLNINKFKKQLQLHFKSKNDYSFNIWSMFILAKWYKEFDF
jgi:asparagine synthase (glutamine-hydrolysing)